MTDPTRDPMVSDDDLTLTPADAVRRGAQPLDPALQASGWAALAADHDAALRLTGSGGAVRLAMPVVAAVLSLAATTITLSGAASGDLGWWWPFMHGSLTVLFTGMSIALARQRGRVVRAGRPAVADPGPPPAAVVEWAHGVMDAAGLGPSPRWPAVSGALRRAEPRLTVQQAATLARRLAR